MRNAKEGVPIPDSRVDTQVDDDDHCETPACAYDGNMVIQEIQLTKVSHPDVVPVLHWLAAHLGKTPEDLHIYDPYFCAGAVVPLFLGEYIRDGINYP